VVTSWREEFTNAISSTVIKYARQLAVHGTNRGASPIPGPTAPFLPRGASGEFSLLGVGFPHLTFWLGLFVLLDKIGLSGQRLDALGKFACRRVTDLARINVRCRGLEQLQPDASYIFCINHVSLMDLFVVFQAIPYLHRSFQDAAHFQIPVYGNLIRLFGQIPIDRKDKKLNQQSFLRAEEMLRAGASFVVFPRAIAPATAG